MADPQPSTSAGTEKDAPNSVGGASTAEDGAQDAVVASTSGSPPPPPPVHVQQPQQLEEPLIFYGRASFKQLHQLLNSTCRVKLERCDATTIGTASGSRVVRKVEDESDTEGNSSSDENEIKVLPVCPPAAAAPSKQNGSSGETKKKGRKRVTGRKRYRCDNCGVSFWNRRTFNQHKKKMTETNGVCPPKRKRYGGWRPKGAWTCNICGKRMKEPTYYLDHMRRHWGDKPFKCGDCGKAFPGSTGLCRHRKIHTGVMQHICVFCDKGFYCKESYWSHLRVHTEEKPFFCKVKGCGASFRQLGSLKNHRRMMHLKK